MLFLLVIVVFWIGLSMFGSQTKFAVSKEMRDLAKPLTPTLKESSLAKIEQKRKLTQSDLEGFTIYKIIEDKGLGGSGVRVVDISYEPPEENISYGSQPTARQGGLSNYLQANPDFAASESATSNPDQAANPAPADQQPAGDQQPADQPPTDQQPASADPSPGATPDTAAPTASVATPAPTTPADQNPTTSPAAQ